MAIIIPEVRRFYVDRTKAELEANEEIIVTVMSIDIETISPKNKITIIL